MRFEGLARILPGELVKLRALEPSDATPGTEPAPGRIRRGPMIIRRADRLSSERTLVMRTDDQPA